MKKNGSRKAKLAFLTALSFFIASAGIASSSFLNAPHDDAHGVACIDCHEFSLTDAAAWGAPQTTIDDTVKNFVCLKCHGPAGSAPTKAMHSDLSLNGTATWTTECVDCHAPHFQRQLAGVADISTAIYLVTGTINSITPAGANTTITYTLGTAQAKWSNPATWSAKTGAGRGLIFVADALNPKGLTYETISADASSITVAGTVIPAMINKTFGLFYGQFLKNKITTNLGDQAVAFYNPYGGFVDDSGSVAPNGVCQVCHTNVIYWTNDGANNTHNAQSRCTLCHDAAQGFKFTGHDHTLTLSTSIGCGDCHTGPDVAGQVHFANCDSCHSSPRQEVIDAIAAGTGAECVTCHVTDFTTIHTAVILTPDTIHNTIVTTGTSLCASCHSDPPPLVDPLDPKIHNACISCHGGINGTLSSLATGIAAPGDCATCHIDPFETIHAAISADHSSLVTATGTQCINCHTSTSLIDPLDPKVHNSCESCHDANWALISLAIGKSFAVGGNCATCHTAPFDTVHPGTIDHSNIVTTTGTACNSCHTGTALIDALDPKVHNGCASCHDVNGALISLALGSSSPGNCNSCHGADFTTIHPDTVNHNALINVGTLSCSSCHSDPPPLVDPADPKVHNACLSCHDTNGALSSRAIGKSFAVGGDCATCHTEAFETIHPTIIDHNTIVTTTGTQCGTCHTSTALIDAADPKVHNDCTTCHDANGALISLATGQAAPGNCITCHGSDVQTVHPSCTTCHGEPPSGTIFPNTEGAHTDHATLGYGSVNPSCGACHDGAAHNGTVDVNIPANFDAQSGSAVVNSGNTCSSTRCHGGQTSPVWSTGTINVDTQCTSCHKRYTGTSPQYNDYSSGEHSKHVVSKGYACTVCHNITKLATGHFTNLETSGFELDPAATIGGGSTQVGSYDGTNCSNIQCHGSERW